MLLISVAYGCDLQPVAQGFRQTFPRSMALATHVSGSWGVNGRCSAGTEGWDRGSGASMYPYVGLRSRTLPRKFATKITLAIVPGAHSPWVRFPSSIIS